MKLGPHDVVAAAAADGTGCPKRHWVPVCARRLRAAEIEVVTLSSSKLSNETFLRAGPL